MEKDTKIYRIRAKKLPFQLEIWKDH